MIFSYDKNDDCFIGTSEQIAHIKVNHCLVKQDYMRKNTIVGTKDTGKVAKDTFCSKKSYKYRR